MNIKTITINQIVYIHCICTMAVNTHSKRNSYSYKNLSVVVVLSGSLFN